MTRLDQTPDLVSIVAHRVAGLRIERQLTLDALARLSGVSRAMLWQIEQGRSAPTIKVLARVAEALDVSVLALLQAGSVGNMKVLRAADTKRLSSDDGRYVSRALFPFSGTHTVEFYELLLAPGASEVAQAHAAGTTENLVVHEGAAEIVVGDTVCGLQAGDALFFHADVPHAYRNPGAAMARIYLVMHYPARLNYG